MKGRKSFIAKFVLTTTMACFLANSVMAPMNAAAAEPEVQLVEDVLQEESTDIDVVSGETKVEYQLGEGIKRETDEVQEVLESEEGDVEAALAGLEKTEENYYKFPSTASYTMKNYRTNKTDTTFRGDSGRYSIIVFGGVGSCWNTSNAIESLLKVASSGGSEEIDLYLIDVKSNSVDRMLGEVGNSESAQRIFIGSHSMDAGAYNLYLTCYNATVATGYTMPLIVYVDKTGTIVDYTTGADGTLYSAVNSRLTAMGISLQKKVSTVAKRTQAEIKAFAKAHPISMLEDITYATNPVTSGNYAPGELSAQSVQNGLNALNQVRYIAGLDANVTLDENLSEQCQAGMLINYVNGVLTHYPTQPAGFPDDLFELGYNGTSHSNIYWCSVPMVNLANATINGWMDDGDQYNIDVLGHRRWILNPRMGKTGFGAVTGSKGVFSAMYSVDLSGSGKQYGVMWPAQNMPVSYFDASMPWCFLSGDEENIYAVSVTLTRVSDGRVWNFANIGPDGYFNVDNSYCGLMGCVVFKPSDLGALRAGDAFDVRITGLNAGPISYRVNFFDLDAADPIPVAITNQPASVTVAEGTKANFTVETTGDVASYQWYYSMDQGATWTKSTAASATTKTFSITAATKWNGMWLKCAIKGKDGVTVKTNSAKLSVKAAVVKPAITTQPTSVTAISGNKATFKVVATGTDLKYQWKYSTDNGTTWKNSTAASATTNTFSITAADKWNGMWLKCYISNSAGQVATSAVKLTVETAPAITTAPVSATVGVGAKATFKVAASGTNLKYQWYYSMDKGASWTKSTAASATTNAFSITAADKWNGMWLKCVISNTAGKVTTTAVKLTVSQYPVITTQPKSVTVAFGAKATFKVATSGQGLTYQWYYSTDKGATWKASTAASATTDTFSITAASKWNGMILKCKVKGANGKVTTTAGATLTVR